MLMKSNFIQVHDFIINSPELKTSAEVLIFSYIYGFKGHRYYGSLETLMKVAHLSCKNTLVKYLQGMVDSGLLHKEKKSYRSVEYTVLRKPIQKQEEFEEIDINQIKF